MNRCNECNVDIYESEQRCPLCHSEIENALPNIKTAVSYPNYREITKRRSQLRKLPVFISISASIICLYINAFTHAEGGILWSIIVVTALIFANGVFYTTRSTARRFGAKVLINHILLSALVIIVDFTTGGQLWSTNYVFPFLTFATIIYLTVLAIRSKRHFSEYFGYILVVMLLGLVPIAIYLLGLADATWGVFLSAICCIIVVIALTTFFFNSLKQEIIKRFHR